jgi:ABC-2 type transport system permease protein
VNAQKAISPLNLRGGWALVRRTWSSWMAQRGFFWLLAFGWMIPPLVYLFVWSAAAGENGVAGMPRGAFPAYYLLIIVVNQMTYSTTNWTVGDTIRYGGLNAWLLRPLPPVFEALATEIAGKVVFMAFVLPAAGVLALLLKPELHPRPGQVLVFIPALLLAWGLRFLWGYWLALLAFWSTRADALLAVQDSLVFLLSGVAAPFALLPELGRFFAAVLPFRYMVGFPVEVLSGQLDGRAVAGGLAAQAGWLLAALLLSVLVWKKGLRRYAAVGG